MSELVLPESFETFDPLVWSEHLGEKVNIVEGDLVLDPDGFLTVSKCVEPYNLLVQGNQAIPICPPSDFRGRAYRFMRSDCVTLCAAWMDMANGSNLIGRISSLTARRYQNLNRFGYEDVVLEFGFTPAEDISHGSLLFYGSMGHIGVCIDGDKILHHPNGKFSCIDSLDESKVLKVYRYAG